MTPPLVLQIANERALEPGSRFVRAFGRLASEGLLRHTVVSPLTLLAGGRETALDQLHTEVRGLRPAAVLVQSPGAFPWTDGDVRALLGLLGDPPVVFWEGDAWGGRKQLTPGSVAWLGAAARVHSVALGPQAALLRRHSRAPVRYVPHVLPLSFDDTPVPPLDQASDDVVAVGNCYVRFGCWGGLEGSLDRVRMVRGLRRLPGCRFAVYGSRWRGRGARGPAPFPRQVEVLRQGRITAGWDHFTGYPGYFSDRLPIALSAGRPHVTSRQPGLEWLPGPETGLHLAGTPAEAVSLVRRLLAVDDDELHAAGLRGHAWVRERLTDREALLHMLGGLVTLPLPPADPWQAFAQPLVPA
ncbi:glycosyltransferase [Streptomyces sp. P9(2023)]|uniref:glycosyltransferase n=1 Tax=Streptomyces sp. P9(2023) TaxID=3064394 RepID=UPI0028F4241B|nr:glycosyltransferase [Streptomyces sp. P9(2023)]MDT9691289.1 glycosyltransferase [Streptomyces sp. P9(2023)]